MGTPLLHGTPPVDQHLWSLTSVGDGEVRGFFVERCVKKTFAYVKEYHINILTEKNIFIMPYGENDEEIYGKNLLSIGSWRIESGCHLEDCLTEINIC